MDVMLSVVYAKSHITLNVRGETSQPLATFLNVTFLVTVMITAINKLSYS